MADHTGPFARRIGRRAVLRGLAVSTAGLAGAALLGCHTNSTSSSSTGPTTRGTVTNAIPSGVDPGLGGGVVASPVPLAIDKGRPGGTLRMGWYVDDVTTLSFMANGGGVTPQSHDFTHGDAYVYGTSAGKILPMLWSTWENPDGQHLVAHLRPNLKMQDDSPMDAAAVKWSMETLRDPKLAPRFTTYRGLLSSLYAPGSVDVVDSVTAKINLKQVDSGFVSNLVSGLPVGQAFSRKQVETLGDKEFTQPRYHGPYTVVDAKPAVGFTSQKFPGYWGGYPGYESYLDAIQWKVIIQSETRAAALQAKELDAAFWREADVVVGNLMKAPGMQTVLYDSSPQCLTINHVAPPFTDLRVRQAAAYAIDRDKIRAVAYAGFGDPLKSIIIPFSFGAKESDPYQYNPAEAMKLLAAAGNPHPKIIYSLTGTPPPALNLQLAALYSEMLKAVGFDVETKQTATTADLGPDMARAVPYVNGGTVGQRFDAYGSWSLRATNEGEIGLRANQPSDPPELRAIQTQINDLVHKGQATIDSNERRDIAFQVSDLYAKNVMGIIPITRTRGTLVARDNVGGMNHPDMGFPLGSGRPRFLWLKA